MRKDITALVATLGESVNQIAASSVEDREALLAKSLGEFETALMDRLDPIMPLEAEDIEEVTPALVFDHTLSKLINDIEMMKGSAAFDDSLIPGLERFVDVGVLTLRSLANDSAEIIESAREAGRAERDGTLFKIDSYDGEEVLVKTDLPDHLRAFITDPVDLLSNMVEIGRSFIDSGIELAEPMVKSEMLTDEFVEAYPELFEKAAPPFPPKKKPAAAAPGAAPAAGADQSSAMADDSADDTGPTDPQDPGDAAGDDGSQNPIELMVRMASIIVVVGGSLLQAGGDPSGQDMGGAAAPAGAQPSLQRSVPLEDIPLEKILGGEIAVSDSVADALEERESLRKSVADMQAERDQLNATLKKMKETVERLSKVDAAPKGRVFMVDKSGDVTLPGAPALDDKLGKVAELAKSNPEAAAREMMKLVHAGGGTPLVPAV